MAGSFQRGKITAAQLTREVLVELIDRIYVYPDQQIDIYSIYFRDWLRIQYNTERRGGMMYQMAAYCRLSKDDGENKISESIENQMKLIRSMSANLRIWRLQTFILMMDTPVSILQTDRNFSG